MKTHRDLAPFPLSDALQALVGALPRARVITMAEGQWNATLAHAYAAGWILIEMDPRERPVAAYRCKDRQDSLTDMPTAQTKGAS